MGSNITTLNWYNVGKEKFTKKGFEAAETQLRQKMACVPTSQKNIMITGANSGLGYTLTKDLVGKGHRVFMLCRNETRAEDARQQILSETPSAEAENLSVVIADCSNPETLCEAINGLEVDSLDCLVCNAGVLANEYRRNPTDTHELTFSVHLLHGYHLLTRLCEPKLKNSSDGRVVVVTSGGAYLAKLSMKKLLCMDPSKYDGTAAYSQAKRAQIILAECFANEIGISCYSAHPGWTLTPGVSAIQSFVDWTGPENWRTGTEGTLGIEYLCLERNRNLTNGGFHLDGEIQPKYLPAKWYSFMGSDTEEKTSERENLWTYCESENGAYV